MATPASVSRSYQNTLAAARAWMEDPDTDPAIAQRIAALDAAAQLAVAEVLRHEGRRASPEQLRRAQAAVAELSAYLAGISQ